MPNKPKPENGPKTAKELEREIEELRAENEYLKKLSALVQGRKDRQPRKSKGCRRTKAAIQAKRPSQGLWPQAIHVLLHDQQSR